MKTLTIGPRIIKSGLAIALSIYLASILVPNSSGVLAGIAALTATSPSLKKSYESLSSRMIGTIIGALVALGLSLVFVSTPVPEAIVIGIASMLTITILNIFNIPEVTNIVIVAVIAILLPDQESFYEASLYRVFETFIGVITAFIINLIIAPPKYDVTFMSLIETTNTENLKLIRTCLRRNTNYFMTQNDLRWSKTQLNKIENYYQLVKNELILNPKKRLPHTRKLVVYRHLYRTTKQASLLLEVLHHNGNLYNHCPEDFRKLIHDRIELLLSAHEQIILKLIGKVPPEEVNFMEITPQYRDHYIQSYQNLIWEWRHDHGYAHSKSNELVLIMSRIYQYEVALKTLNRLVKTFKKFHAKGYSTEFDHSISQHLNV